MLMYEDIIIVNVMVFNKWNLIYIKKRWIKVKGRINKSIIIFRGFKVFFWVIDWKSRLKINRYIEDMSKYYKNIGFYWYILSILFNNCRLDYYYMYI